MTLDGCNGNVVGGGFCARKRGVGSVIDPLRHLPFVVGTGITPISAEMARSASSSVRFPSYASRFPTLTARDLLLYLSWIEGVRELTLSHISADVFRSLCRMPKAPLNSQQLVDPQQQRKKQRETVLVFCP